MSTRSKPERSSVRRSGGPATVVTSVSAGPGISITGTPTDPIVNNTGVLTATAGPGISITGTAQNPIVNNTGVLSVTAGTGINLTGTAANPIVNNGGVLSLNGSVGAQTGYISRIYEADSLQNPDSADWAVNALAPAGADGTSTAEVVRFFDDTTEEGVGFTSILPASTVNLEFEFLFWANVAPAATRTFAFKLYARRLQNNTAIGAYTNFTLTDFSIPNNRTPQIQSKTVSYASFGTALVAGAAYTFELTRVNPAAGTELVGDLNLRAFRLFSS